MAFIADRWTKIPHRARTNSTQRWNSEWNFSFWNFSQVHNKRANQKGSTWTMRTCIYSSGCHYWFCYAKVVTRIWSSAGTDTNVTHGSVNRNHFTANVNDRSSSYLLNEYECELCNRCLTDWLTDWRNISIHACAGDRMPCWSLCLLAAAAVTPYAYPLRSFKYLRKRKTTKITSHSIRVAQRTSI